MEDRHLVTVTRLWTYGRRLHGGPFRWLGPVSHRTLGWGVVVFVPLWVLLALLGVGFDSARGMISHFSVPILGTWWLLRVGSGGQKPSELLRSWAGFGWYLTHRQDSLHPVRVRSRARIG